MWQLYILQDTIATETMGAPFPARTLLQAIRQFNTILANPQTMPGQHPADFVLLEIGAMDPDTGKLYTNDELPRIVMTGDDFLREQQNDKSAMHSTRLHQGTNDQGEQAAAVAPPDLPKRVR